MRKLLRKVSFDIEGRGYLQKYLYVICCTRCALTVRVEVAVDTVCRGMDAEELRSEVRAHIETFLISAIICAANHVSKAQAAHYSLANAPGTTMDFRFTFTSSDY
jgi:hypothetical protein